MPEIQPFRAWLYSKKFKSEISNLISPPYDVISKDFHEELKGLHPQNSVRLCLVDSPDDQKSYETTAATFSSWKQEGVFEQAPAPSLYLTEEEFEIDGQQRRRLGFVSLVRVTPFEEKRILPHEFTLAGPKKDRLALLKAMNAELSQIFLCYRDEKQVLENIHKKLIDRKAAPDAEMRDYQGVKRKMWIVSDPIDIAAVQNMLKDQSVLIADGHHRFETAVAFSKEEPNRGAYVQAYFTNLAGPEFTILPIHRLFSLPENLSAEMFMERLKEIFTVETWKGELSLPKLMALRKSDPSKIYLVLALSGSKDRLLISRKKNSQDDAEIFALQKDIFERVLDWDTSKVAKGVIQYEHETQDFLKTLSALPRGAGFFLPSTDIDLVMRRAQQGERMPQKSTFFYPKLASGLITYELPK